MKGIGCLIAITLVDNNVIYKKKLSKKETVWIFGPIEFHSILETTPV